MVPADVSEYVAVDIAILGPDATGSEHTVTICAKDRAMPYDYNLTNRLIAAAEGAGCDFAVDVFYRYGSDAGQAIKGGNNVKAALFGMGVYASHGVEKNPHRRCPKYLALDARIRFGGNVNVEGGF